MSLQYKKILVIGATSGIGHALAARFVETGSSVIVVGRRKENLDKFVADYGSKGNVDQAVFDITDFANIPEFVREQFTKHPDIDSVFINAGLQRHLDWTKPEDINVDNIDLEWQTNYFAYLRLSRAVLPYLLKSSKETSIMYTGSGLGLVPNITNSNYSATKAALHHVLLVMRQQLQDAGHKIKIIEILPPAVQTELHDAKHQPEFGDKGRSFGMPLDDFTNEAFEGLVAGKDQIAVGGVRTFMGFDDWEQQRQKHFAKLVEAQKQNRHGSMK